MHVDEVLVRESLAIYTFAAGPIIIINITTLKNIMRLNPMKRTSLIVQRLPTQFTNPLLPGA